MKFLRLIKSIFTILPVGLVIAIAAIIMTRGNSSIVQMEEDWMKFATFGFMTAFFLIEIIRSMDIGKVAFAWDTTTSLTASGLALFAIGVYNGAGGEILPFHYIVLIGLCLDSIVCPIISFAMGLRNFGSVDGSAN